MRIYIAIRTVVSFIVDATESMGPFLDAVRIAIYDFIDILLQAGVEVEFGLVLFHDESIGEKTLCFDVGISPDEIKSILAQTKPEGGGDLPESALLGIRHAVRLKGIHRARNRSSV